MYNINVCKEMFYEEESEEKMKNQRLFLETYNISKSHMPFIQKIQNILRCIGESMNAHSILIEMNPECAFFQHFSKSWAYDDEEKEFKYDYYFLVEDLSDKEYIVLTEGNIKSYIYPININQKIDGLIVINFSLDKLYIFENKTYFKFDNTKILSILAMIIGNIFRNEHKEKEIIRSRNIREAIIDNLPFITWMKDLEGRYLAVNRKFSEKSKISVKDIYEKNDYDIWSEDIANRYKQLEKSVLYNQKNIHLEEKIENNEKIQYLETYVSPVFDYNKKLIGTVGYEKDITQRKDLEEQLLNSYKEMQIKQKEIEIIKKGLEEANKSKDKLISLISHDLRGLLSVMFQISEAAMDPEEDFEIEELQEFIRRIYNNAKKSLDLLENLLQWAKENNGGIVFQPSYIDLFDMVNNGISLVSTSAKNKNIEIISSIKEKTEIYCDKNMMETIIRNLLVNAIKFTNNGEKITITYNEEEFCHKILIIDSGIGMDTKIKDNLFIFDKDNVREGTLGEKGTGLGLLLCKEFIDKHRGEILIESEVDKGSTFIIKLPKNKVLNTEGIDT